MKLIYKHNITSYRKGGIRPGVYDNPHRIGRMIPVIARPDFRKDSAYMSLEEYHKTYKKL